MTRTYAGEDRDRLLGAWRLLAWEVTEADGTVSRPLGEAVVGQLVYEDGGRMSAQLVRADRPAPVPAPVPPSRPAFPPSVSQEEMTSPGPGYFGYFGTFTLDAAAGTVTHHIESCSFPGLTGTPQVREYRLDGRRLTLGAVTEWGRVRIVWERFG